MFPQPPPKMTERKNRVPVSRQIARRSKSNLALALSTLPRKRRHDMMTFYAFCRVIDDIADEPVNTVEERGRSLLAWRNGLLHGFASPDELQAEIETVIRRYSIPRSLLVEIVDGVACDLKQSRYETYDDLLAYCYKVACVVGLVSIEIFGYKNPACKDYSVALGYALQITNIIRDVGEDARNGRIYLPQEDLKRFVPFRDRIPIVRTTKETLADDLRALLRDPARWHALGAAGRRFVEECHDPLKIAQRTIAAYHGPCAA